MHYADFLQCSAYLIQIGCQGIVMHYGFFFVCSLQSVYDIPQTHSWSTLSQHNEISLGYDADFIVCLFCQQKTKQNTPEYHHSRNIADKGVGRVLLFQSCRRLCLAFAVQSMGHWQQKNLHAHRAQKKKKKKLCVCVCLTLIPSDIRTPVRVAVTYITGYFWFQSGGVVSLFHLKCRCDVNG